MITIQNYVRAMSLEEAYRLNQSPRNRIVGGMHWIKMSRGSVGVAIDLCDLGLDRIEENGEEFSIGAMVSLRDIELSESLNEYTNGAVRNAVKDIVSVQFRNTATVGGSLWGRFGFSDVLTVFLAMDSYVELYKGGIIPLGEFSKMKYDKDVLVRLIVKKAPGRFVYNCVRIQRTDFPVLNCAFSNVNGSLRAVIGARPGRAMVFSDEKGILCGGINENNAKLFGEYLCEKVPVSSNMRGSAEYRSHLVKVLTERCLAELGGEL